MEYQKWKTLLRKIIIAITLRSGILGMIGARLSGTVIPIIVPAVSVPIMIAVKFSVIASVIEASVVFTVIFSAVLFAVFLRHPKSQPFLHALHIILQAV